MPGHIKKSEGPDPDPSPWLIVSPELKNKLKAKPYDPKKSCWVPNKATHGYDEGLIESTDGDKVTVKLLEGNEVKETCVGFLELVEEIFCFNSRYLHLLSCVSFSKHSQT
jgi:hypothetical protein